jgi:secondary thiamine-phosphate synthase enzyme
VTIHQETLTLRTRKGLTDVTREVQGVVARAGITRGLCVVFIQHTSASLVIQENADRAVLTDLESWMGDLAPESRRWEHDAEGPDDMPAHARAAITKTSETLVVSRGALALGTWQTLYVWEHRDRPHSRSLLVHVTGE